MNPPSGHMVSVFENRAVRWSLIAAIWTLPALIFGTLAHTRMTAIGEPSSLWVWIFDHLVAWYAWAAFSPLIVWLAHRFRLDRAPYGRAIAVHLLAAATVAVLHSALAAFASITLHGEPGTLEYFLSQYIPYLAWRSPWSLVIYGIVLVVTYATEYYTRARHEAVRAATLEGQFSRAQLEALQQQLQPHFLFNVLNSISVLVQKGDARGATDMLNGLSELLRQVLRRDRNGSGTLANELDFVRRYLAIEQIRFGDRLRVSYDIGSNVQVIPFPAFLLQSFVENAVRHGIAEKAGKGNIHISAQQEAERLRVTVEDDGVGMNGSGSSSQEGVGMRNARARLEMLYGESYRMDISDRTPEGTKVVIDIPIAPQPTVQ